MKTSHGPVTLLLTTLISGSLQVRAQLVENFTFNSNFGGQPTLAIPDGNSVGASDDRSLTAAMSTIQSLTVTMNISGTFNGDLYAYLRHGSDFVVLLNRPGSALGNSAGYADSGLNVTFADGAANGDIHNYQMVLTPALGTQLTGTWAPDGRNVDPASVLETSARSTSLSSFAGSNPSGSWTLFVADMDSGGANTLTSWSLNITEVPEPRDAIAFTGLALIGFVVWRKRRSQPGKAM